MCSKPCAALRRPATNLSQPGRWCSGSRKRMQSTRDTRSTPCTAPASTPRAAARHIVSAGATPHSTLAASRPTPAGPGRTMCGSRERTQYKTRPAATHRAPPAPIPRDKHPPPPPNDVRLPQTQRSPGDTPSRHPCPPHPRTARDQNLAVPSPTSGTPPRQHWRMRRPPPDCHYPGLACRVHRCRASKEGLG